MLCFYTLAKCWVPCSLRIRVYYKILQREEAGTQMLVGTEINLNFTLCSGQQVLFQMYELSGSEKAKLQVKAHEIE